ncbi:MULTISPECIES: MBL fold metallo-hydrolase [unclassified Leifsonia]|uniref:MBL fold metallo-hydrolase n=1 Tax=unclassified Leifsonia TaxID=2663824 RepID=UPI0008A73CBF|nr:MULTISPECIES: MBL fold metallo-hydrolase [unclassified Leifsonia]SEI03064.1 Glyoxylase, beta-lactamase superfamily II [Leifsonia sp. CL154]SFL72240.1 Glyoxylase, beta-lactamase superfamily II [Leifsonia sp. CL147]
MTTPILPARHAWFRRELVAPGIERIDEPHVHEFLRSNIWFIKGRDRDLVVDAGLGVASLHDTFPDIFIRDPILAVTHAHLDHVGSAHEFADRRMHRHSQIGGQTAASLLGPELAALLGLDAAQLPAVLVDAVPARFTVESYQIKTAPATSTVSDGDVINLGDRHLLVLHLPGHTPGSICLLDDESGDLFSGDVIYDDILLDELHESDIDQYVASMLRLRSLPVRTVYPGHGYPFDQSRMIEIIDNYLRIRAPHAMPRKIRCRSEHEPPTAPGGELPA